MAGAGESLGLAAREPGTLGVSISGKMFSPITQDLMAVGVDPLGLGGRAMIHPGDDVAGGIVGRPDRQRPPGRVDDDERTGGVEPETR